MTAINVIYQQTRANQSTVHLNGEWRGDTLNARKSMMWKCLSGSSNLAIFWVVMVLSENFTVRAPKCRAEYKQSKTS